MIWANPVNTILVVPLSYCAKRNYSSPLEGTTTTSSSGNVTILNGLGRGGGRSHASAPASPVLRNDAITLAELTLPPGVSSASYTQLEIDVHACLFIALHSSSSPSISLHQRSWIVTLASRQTDREPASERDQMEGRGCNSASSKRSTSFLNLNPMDMKRCAPRRWVQWHYIQVVTASIAAPSADVADANVMPKREHSASVCCCCCALEKKLNEEGKALVSWSSSNLLLPSSTTHPNYELYCICPLAALSSYIFCSPLLCLCPMILSITSSTAVKQRH